MFTRAAKFDISGTQRSAGVHAPRSQRNEVKGSGSKKPKIFPLFRAHTVWCRAANIGTVTPSSGLGRPRHPTQEWDPRPKMFYHPYRLPVYLQRRTKFGAVKPLWAGDNCRRPITPQTRGAEFSPLKVTPFDADLSTMAWWHI